MCRAAEGERPPESTLDAVHRHLVRATESEESLARYRRLFAEVRLILVLAAVAVVVCVVQGGGAVLVLVGAVALKGVRVAGRRWRK